MPRVYPPLRERLLAKRIIDPETGCWLWTGKGRVSYGRMKVNGQERYVHRLSYEEFVGPIPDGLPIDHLCRVHSCFNPKHLEPVTQRENLLRGKTVTAWNATKTHCPQGHPYTPENTYIRPGTNSRNCRTCNRQRIAAA